MHDAANIGLIERSGLDPWSPLPFTVT